MDLFHRMRLHGRRPASSFLCLTVAALALFAGACGEGSLDSGTSYAAVRRYEGAIDSTEIARRVREGFLPIISEVDGFLAYYVIDAGGGVIASTSVFRDQAGAERSTAAAADWVRENLAALLPNPPQITAGQVVAREEHPTPPFSYATVRRYEGAIDSPEIARRVRAGFQPIISEIDGFVSYYLIDEGDGVIVSISVFRDQAGADASNVAAADWVRENLAPLLPNPPQITEGTVVAHG